MECSRLCKLPRQRLVILILTATISVALCCAVIGCQTSGNRELSLNIGGSENIVFILIPARSKPGESFYISRYETTYGAWQIFVDSGGYASAEYWEGLSWRPRSQEALPQHWSRILKRPNYRELPVTHINTSEAIAFARWLSEQTGFECKLPTEDQWEHAASHSQYSTSLYPWGDVGKNGPDDADLMLCTSGYFRRRDKNTLAPVGSAHTDVSRYGIYDMAGSVSEWVRSDDDYFELKGGWYGLAKSLTLNSTAEEVAFFAQQFTIAARHTTSPDSRSDPAAGVRYIISMHE